MTLETRRAGPALRMKINGITTGKVDRNTRRKTPTAPTPIVLAQTGSLGRLGQLLQTLVHRFEFGWRQDARDHRWQRFRYDALRFFWIGRFAHGAKRYQSLPLFCQTTHQIQDSVNDSPGQIASQRANEHRAHIIAPRLGHAERAGEGKDHDQAEEDFGNTINRI